MSPSPGVLGAKALAGVAPREAQALLLAPAAAGPEGEAQLTADCAVLFLRGGGVTGGGYPSGADAEAAAAAAVSRLAVAAERLEAELRPELAANHGAFLAAVSRGAATARQLAVAEKHAAELCGELDGFAASVRRPLAELERRERRLRGALRLRAAALLLAALSRQARLFDARYQAALASLEKGTHANAEDLPNIAEAQREIEDTLLAFAYELFGRERFLEIVGGDAAGGGGGRSPSPHPKTAPAAANAGGAGGAGAAAGGALPDSLFPPLLAALPALAADVAELRRNGAAVEATATALLAEAANAKTRPQLLSACRALYAYGGPALLMRRLAQRFAAGIAALAAAAAEQAARAGEPGEEARAAEVAAWLMSTVARFMAGAFTADNIIATLVREAAVRTAADSGALRAEFAARARAVLQPPPAPAAGASATPFADVIWEALVAALQPTGPVFLQLGQLQDRVAGSNPAVVLGVVERELAELDLQWDAECRSLDDPPADEESGFWEVAEFKFFDVPPDAPTGVPPRTERFAGHFRGLRASLLQKSSSAMKRLFPPAAGGSETPLPSPGDAKALATVVAAELERAQPCPSLYAEVLRRVEDALLECTTGFRRLRHRHAMTIAFSPALQPTPEDVASGRVLSPSEASGTVPAAGPGYLVNARLNGALRELCAGLAVALGGSDVALPLHAALASAALARALQGLQLPPETRGLAKVLQVLYAVKEATVSSWFRGFVGVVTAGFFPAIAAALVEGRADVCAAAMEALQAVSAQTAKEYFQLLPPAVAGGHYGAAVAATLTRTLISTVVLTHPCRTPAQQQIVCDTLCPRLEATISAFLCPDFAELVPYDAGMLRALPALLSLASPDDLACLGPNVYSPAFADVLGLLPQHIVLAQLYSRLGGVTPLVAAARNRGAAGGGGAGSGGSSRAQIPPPPAPPAVASPPHPRPLLARDIADFALSFDETAAAAEGATLASAAWVRAFIAGNVEPLVPDQAADATKAAVVRLLRAELRLDPPEAVGGAAP